MSNAAKILVLLLLAAVAGGAYFLFQQPAATPVTPQQPPSQPAIEQPQDPQPAPPIETQDPIVKPTERIEAAGAGAANADAKQGVRGRVLRPDGMPAANARVLIVPSAINDPVQIFLRNKQGQATPVIAETTTAADGEFVLGLRESGKPIDLRCIDDEFPEMTRGQLKVSAGDWYDTGDMRFEQGLVVQGRVLDSRSKAAVSNATVFLTNASQSHALVATPGRERGVIALTDQGGFFRFTSAPRIGLVSLTVEAENYAAGNLLNQQLKSDAPNEFVLEIERGQPLTGVVVDQNGGRIAGAKVVALSLSPKAPQNETLVTGDDGSFEFPNLHPGPYRLTATAARFAETELPLALAGEDVKVVMSTQGSVKLRVLGADGRPAKAYHLSLKRSFPNNPLAIGNVIGHPDRNINPSDYPRDLGGDWALIDGLPGGDFRFQISERRHAKTLSPQFTVNIGADPIEVTATLTLGAALTGTVIDDRGQPVAGATVTTDMNGGIAANSGIFDVFRSMIPEKHTNKKATTDAQGRFKIEQLSFADYMVRVAHPDYCEGVAIDITLDQEGQVIDAGVIQMMRGAMVEGITTVDGQPMGQVKISVSMPLNAAAGADGKPNLPPGQTVLFSATVLSDGDGRFQLLKRVPPGSYKITASRQSAESPFMALMDIKHSEQQIVVAPGQDVIRMDFNLPSR